MLTLCQFIFMFVSFVYCLSYFKHIVIYACILMFLLSQTVVISIYVSRPMTSLSLILSLPLHPTVNYPRPLFPSNLCPRQSLSCPRLVPPPPTVSSSSSPLCFRCLRMCLVVLGPMGQVWAQERPLTSAQTSALGPVLGSALNPALRLGLGLTSGLLWVQARYTVAVCS